MTVAGCNADAPAPPPTTSPTGKPLKLSFGVYGPTDEVAAFQAVTDHYNSLNSTTDVSQVSFPDSDALIKSIKAGDVPDVFMASRTDLAYLQQEGLTQPVDALLDERGVDFGDGYSRDSLEAFSSDSRLQCMPYGISPLVIYFNKKLLNFEKMRARGLNAPNNTDGDFRWSFEQYAVAARAATKPRRGTRGLYVPATLQGLAPFIYSGGGQLFDDEEDPTSLAFSDGATQSALSTVLPLLRDPTLTLTQRQLSKASPLAWFERGKLGMIEGFRSLVPELRQVQGLDFDVMPTPILDGSATVADISGMCLSADVANTPEAADLLYHVVSTPSVERVTHTGYLTPANLEVALSEEFTQPGRLPTQASVFTSSVRAVRVPPLIDSTARLETAVEPSLRELLMTTVIDDLPMLGEEIDQASRTVLDPAGASSSPSGE